MRGISCRFMFGGSALNKKKGVSYAKWGYIFALPFCIAYLIFMIYPIFNTFAIGFTNMTDRLQMQIAQEEIMGIEPTAKVEILENAFENYANLLRSGGSKYPIIQTKEELRTRTSGRV